jgi:hypothetical protein
MRLLWLLNVAFLLSHSCSAQSLSKEEFTGYFAFEVHSVDDFFERFNFKRSTAFQNYLTKKFPDVKVSRESFLLSLFNRQNTAHNPVEIRNFVEQILDTTSPKLIKYSDKDWYADLNCKVVFKGRTQQMNLILKVERANNGGYSWDIVSAKAAFLKFKSTRIDSSILFNGQNNPKLKQSENSAYFLTPVSHGIDFLNVDNVFSNHLKITNYIYPGPRSFELNKLIYLIQKGELKFIQIDRINYHLLQIDGWILILDYFRRKDSNSGWLIDQLVKVNEDQKKVYRNKNLNIPLN